MPAPTAFRPAGFGSGAFDADSFLRDDWQQRPRLIRNPWAEWRNPLEPGDLAGLACADGVEARLVRRTRKRWKVEFGPLPAKRFATLDKHPWTLLVQAVDHHVPAVAALVAPFRFVPNWRIDDVMVSYATDGGGVGPHFDQYDVFLVQGLGRRRWRVGGRCDAATPLLPHEDLKLLASFEATDEWVLEPGDILYVPPGFAHDGEAVGDDCMTYSVGFRAPSRSELIAHWADHLLAELDDDDRYADAGLRRQDNAGEIDAAALDRLHAMITDRLQDRDAFARWFGQYNSEPKNPEMDWRPDVQVDIAAVRAALAADRPLVRNPASRFSFVRQRGGVMLFVDGTATRCEGEVAAAAERLCAADRVTLSSDAAAALIVTLCNQGSVIFASGEPCEPA